MDSETLARADALRKRIVTLRGRLNDLNYATRPDAHAYIRYETDREAKSLSCPSLNARAIHAIECEANAVRYELNQTEMELEAL